MRLFVFLLCLVVVSCGKSKQEQGEQLYAMHCARCHTLPKTEYLTKELWAAYILPEMGARMGIRDPKFNPFKGYSYEEQYELIEQGIYSSVPTIAENDWELLKAYILQNAPDVLPQIPKRQTQPIKNFDFNLVALDSISGTTISFLDFDKSSQTILTGDLNGSIKEYQFKTDKTEQLFNAPSPVTATIDTESGTYITAVGILDPSQEKEGEILLKQGDSITTLATELHRPVHTLIHDFNTDGKSEIVVSEFGNLTGSLSLLKQNDQGEYEKSILIQNPGAMKSIVRDMNNDGKDDIVFLKAQGDESIMVLYQKEDLTFSRDYLVRFSPIYGTSWFEMVDIDHDGDEDIITVHGDNADKTQILKPYHGMRIYLNDGNNEFEESFFYPMYGATRSETADFDQDGDMDIALISTFPNYDDRPVNSFIYLENTGRSEFEFITRTLPEEADGKWFLMKAADIDADGDQDIVLSAFTYFFSTIPKDLAEKWSASSADLLILENTLH
ncbi:FG-GAP repeat domain-containing protein [Flagellimonas zhangzhouensis]|uniref:Repeat domain-containing protein n=1 Tax=Flagellimonas zhangzhouensis TaxID=1073328 RepID=A0A1H2YC93_9FLAO|nr:VCBS repeat-containing protein [Allomuricauda zhangzhouensis]SDQ97747.1 Repeat domain-containing protein [Allomuricauda zhangzhouensis]SDX02139.1 Repeat domain-containing protein [Allomuricauda zhangzhouensis]